MRFLFARAAVAISLSLVLTSSANAQAGTTEKQGVTPEAQAGAQSVGTATKNSNTGKTSGEGDTAGERTESATGEPVLAKAVAPAPAPAGPAGRPRIGLALGGGGALAMSEIGVLQWFQEHHIPVDDIAGTSMGCMVGALYSTGKTIDQMKGLMDDQVFNSVFSFSSSYTTRSFRRREDSRELPNSLTIGLKHGVSFRNAVLADQGLNAFLDRQFLRYDDRTEFNDLPIPLRCIATDLTDAKTVTFSRGSLPDAVRASVSLPAVYPPFLLNGHSLVDGGVLDNLPTSTVRGMHAEVILAVSLPISPLGKGDLGSLLGVLQRSFSVAIEGAEREQRKLSNVVIEPDLQGFTQTDYLKTNDLARRGYQAAERNRTALLRYQVSDAQWAQYIAERAARRPPPAGPILRIRVMGPNESVKAAVERKAQPLVNQPVDPTKLDAVLDQIRADGRYTADYTVGYEDATPDRPIVLITVGEKKTGPPFLEVGANVESQAGGITRATVEGILVHQDLGSYGSELRAHIKLGWETELSAEYFRRVHDTGTSGGYFVAPAGGFDRHPYNIFSNQARLSERLLQTAGGGLDFGWNNGHTREVRVGYRADNVRWTRTVGSDGLPDLFGSAQRGHIRYDDDHQDRALVPHFGTRVTLDAAYLHDAVSSVDAPQITAQIKYAHSLGKNDFLMAAEGGTMFHRNVSQPFLFTLGGPLRLTASAIDEYRGTDYFLVEPAYLRQIAKLPDPLGQSIYLGVGYEAGQMRSPTAPTITQQDVFFGIVAETPLGVITLAPSFGTDDHRKFTFTLGRVF